ncbi:MAG: MFS transporter [Rhizobiaceae bacterium]|nr:MFS transporter [Rhizobiaceae bacterium]
MIEPDAGAFGNSRTERSWFNPAPSLKTGVAGWIAYGMGGSGYLLMIPTIGYAAYFRTQVVADERYADALWALAVAIPLVLAGAVAPLIGAHADATGRRKAFLLLLTAISCLLTASLALVGPGDIILGMLAFIGAHAAFLLAKALYDSYLPVLTNRGSLSLLSGLGWGLGYLGSLFCYLLCLPFVAGGSEDSDPARFSLAFLVTGVFFAVVGLTSSLFMPADSLRRPGDDMADAYRRVRKTVVEWRQNKPVLTFLIAYYLINDAIVTVLFFIGIFFKSTFGLQVNEILKLTLLFYAVGVPATIAFGWLGRVWSERGALAVTLAIWLVLIGIMTVGDGAAIPVIVAVGAGLVIGSSQALCRSIYASMIPVERSSEFFGFNALVGRASAALGPLTFGLVSAATGSQRIAMASLALFIIAGGYLLLLQYRRDGRVAA